MAKNSTGNIFFTSDTHYFHKNIIKYCNRPYQFEMEMVEGLVENHNKMVGPKDTIYHLGDVSWEGPVLTKQTLGRLNGKKHLIAGNHDKVGLLMGLGVFDTCNAYSELKVDGQFLVLCHYPIESWNKKHHGSLHLHGHCHGTLGRQKENRFDVGVDCWEMSPVSLEELLSLKIELSYYPRDGESRHSTGENS